MQYTVPPVCVDSSNTAEMVALLTPADTLTLVSDGTIRYGDVVGPAVGAIDGLHVGLVGLDVGVGTAVTFVIAYPENTGAWETTIADSASLVAKLVRNTPEVTEDVMVLNTDA
jgi:hypothetical protein